MYRAVAGAVIVIQLRSTHSLLARYLRHFLFTFGFLLVSSTSRWMLTCDSIFQILIWKWSERVLFFFLVFPSYKVQLFFLHHLLFVEPTFFSSLFSSTIFLSVVFILYEWFVCCVSFVRFDHSMNAHFMSQNSDWHESNVRIVQPSTSS